MKLHEGHHIKTEGLTQEQYEAFCQECIRQGFDEGEFCSDMTYRSGDWLNWYAVGIQEGEIYHGDDLFCDQYVCGLITYTQAMSDEPDAEAYALLDNIKELRNINAEIKRLQERKTEIEELICDELEMGL